MSHRSLALATLLAFSSLGPAGAFAQTASEMTSGEVRKVDKDAGKITIKHGEIKSMEMPPMTMVFTADTPALLDKVKAGDKIRFNAVQKDGKIVVTEIVAQ